ncbi:MAG TPA: hypothetical protein VGF59_14985 [Bryobacteraceae bacterium]
MSRRKPPAKRKLRRRAAVPPPTVDAPELEPVKESILAFPRGPRKVRKPGMPESRYTTHKARAVWFQERASYPVREAHVRTLVDERARVLERLPAPPPAAPEWVSAGPTNIGGRCTSLAVHPATPDTVYIGAAGGGVWKSDDAGASWTPLWHDQPVLNIGSLALDPKAPATIYCGTGEANGSADSYAGVGLYRSQDAGATWSLIATPEANGIPRRMGTIAIDPFDSQHIRIGGVSHSGSDPSAMFTSRDGGAHWQRENFVSAANYWCHAIVFHPKKKGVIFATVDENGAKNGIWRTANAGQTWTRLSNGLPPGSANFARTSLAIAPSKPNTIYALAATGDEHVLGVFRSDDMGDKWTSIGGAHFRNEGQMTYGNTIVVHPKNANWVLCGGVDLHLTQDGGKTWTRASQWDADRGTKHYAHADHHALVMPAAAPGRVYDANDGGMDVSKDGGLNWANRSNGLAATMFYDIDVAPSDARNYGGGAQDNGTVVTVTGGPSDFQDLLGGDGGWMVYNPTDARALFGSVHNVQIYRFRPSDGWKDVSPPEDQSVKDQVWMVYIEIDPKNPKRVFTGTFRMWRTLDEGDAWKAVSPVFDGSAISAICVSLADSKYVYAGTEKGGFFRSTDAGQTWSGNLAGSTLPGRIVTRIETSPDRAENVFITVGGIGAGAGISHVFRSDDAGTTWNDIDHGRLPNVPHHVIVFQLDSPNTFFVGSDAGVFMTPDLGSTWVNYNRNLPNAMVVDLVYHTGERTLSAATYGRSIWKIKVS